jgi:16S rRNA (adenine1518-N6/adenine1519-N6)-dimethyltransferase
MISPRTLLQSRAMMARKRLGQNFLTNPAVAEQIVAAAAIESHDAVLEIGAGLGALTIPAARRADTVLAVDKDPRLFDLLRRELAAQGIANVQLIEADFLELDLADHLPAGSGALVVIGNLPYNISSQIIVRLIRTRRFIRRAVLMLQKEMADRLLAPPGSRDFGRLSVMLQYCADLRQVITVDAAQFFPRPRVSSAVIAVRFREWRQGAAVNEDLLFNVVKAAFGQRRKTLRNALRGSFLDLPPALIDRWLQAVAVDPRRRAETLSVEEFVRLGNWLDQHQAAGD